MIVGNDDAPNSLYRSNGAGGFLPPIDLGPLVHQTRAVVVAQLRGSGDYDLLVGNYLESNLYFPGTPTGFGAGVSVFSGSETTATTSLAAGDVNGDGRADVVEGNDGQTNMLYLATAAGFSAGVAIGSETDATMAILLGDFDNDFDLDVIAGNVGAPNRIYRNQGDGTFDTALDLDAEPDSTSGLAMVDFDFDGDLDVLASNNSGGWAYFNDGAGHFTRGTFPGPPEATHALALDPSIGYLATPAGAAIRQLGVGTGDVFAAVLDPTGGKLLFSTYVGGSGTEFRAWGLDADGTGNLYIAATTYARDFPVIGALQPGFGGGASDSFLIKFALDADADGLLDGEDNCSEIANPDQRDTNGDGFGNACDPDLHDDGIMNFLDLGRMKAVFFGTDADADLDGDGHVNFVDLATLKRLFFQPPGPGGIATGPSSPSVRVSPGSPPSRMR